MSSPRSALPTLLHPASGLLILGLDWLLFSGSVITLGLSTPALAALGALLGAGAVSWIQARYDGDARGKSLLKGVLSGLVVGIPLPVAGTAAAGLVLALSGMDRLRSSSDSSALGPAQEDGDGRDSPTPH